MANYSTCELVRRPWESGHTPFKRATTYARIKDGTHPPAIKVGRMSVWSLRELSAVNEAIAAGVPDADLRAYVAHLVEERGLADEWRLPVPPQNVVRTLPPLGDEEI